MVVESLAESLAVFVSPPPLTVAAFETAPVAAPTFTVTVIAELPDHDAPAASASLLVHVTVASVQLHPLPEMAVALIPAGNASVTVTTPLVAPFPLFRTDSV